MSTARRSAARASWAGLLRAAEVVALSILLVVITTQPGYLPVAASDPAAAPASAPALDPNAPDFGAIDAYVEAQVKDLGLPGLALGIVQGGQIVHLKGFGVADPSGRLVTPQTPFSIGSLTKLLTATAVMQLVEAGTVELDAPVQRYIPWFRAADPDASARITIRHLLTHTSGLSRTTDYEFLGDRDIGAGALERRVRALRTAELNRPVGASYEYSNAGYQTLGLIIEMVSGDSYEVYLREHLFEPLGMRRTFASPLEAEPSGMATGYRRVFGVLVPTKPADLPFTRGDLGSGYLISSTEDLARFMIAHLNEGRSGGVSVLSPQGITTLQQPAAQAAGDSRAWSGMDWDLRPKYGVPTLSHTGDDAYFHANLVLIANGRWGVVVLATGQDLVARQVGGDRRLSGITSGVVSLLTGQQPPTFPASRVPLLIYCAIPLIAIVQLVGMARSVVVLRVWSGKPDRRPGGRLELVRQIGLPLVLNLAWGSLLLLFVPRLVGYPLPAFLEFTPEIGYTLVVSGGVALGWALLRTALAVWPLRERGVARPVPRPLSA